MDGLGGINPSAGGLTLGLVQFQVPVVTEPTHLKETADKIADLVRVGHCSGGHDSCTYEEGNGIGDGESR